MSEETKRKRRWLNLAEFVAVAGLVIATLGLWNSYTERRAAALEKKAAAAAAEKASTRFELRGEVAKGNGRIMLLRDERHALRDVRLTFPTALKLAPRQAVAHTIEKGWFDDALLAATDGGPDARVGRLPVLVRYDYVVDDRKAARTAVYDIVWRTRGRWFQGRELAITDFRLREPGGSQARIDALWARELRP
jgi:hypothetical protein